MSRSPDDEDSPSHWRLLASEYLHRHPWLTLRRDRVQLPSGDVIDDFYVWEYPPWVNVIAVTDAEQLVMVRQYRHGLGAVHFELPGGVVDPADTDPLMAARRELLEETGYGGGDWSPWLTCSANPSTHSNLTHSFLAEGVERLADPRPEAGEDLRVTLVPISDVRKLVDTGSIMQSLHLAPLLKYLLSRT